MPNKVIKGEERKPSTRATASEKGKARKGAVQVATNINEEVNAAITETLDDTDIGSVFLLDGKYIKGEYVVKKLGVTEKTLITLAEGGEFSMGRVAGVMVIDTQTFYRYLDRVHFKAALNPADEPAVDSKGKVKVGLTLVGENHTDVPELKPISEFAKDFGLDDRTFIRHCDIGTFQHYRIGSLYKMSKEDFAESLAFVTSSGMKSNRGSRKAKTGRPNKVKELMSVKAAALAAKK